MKGIVRCGKCGTLYPGEAPTECISCDGTMRKTVEWHGFQVGDGVSVAHFTTPGGRAGMMVKNAGKTFCFIKERRKHEG